MAFAFNPPDGYKNKSAFPTTPASEDDFRAKMWSPFEQVRDYINAAFGDWRIYNDITELGLTPGTETMEDICAALPSRSMLIYAKNASNTSPAYPGTIGVLIVTRVTGARVALEFFSSSGGRPVKLVGFYNSGASPQFTGWAREALEYETGTWTPELWFGSSNSDITYSMRTGRYTRIGNIVYFTFRLDLTSKGSASGVASITGLPFTSMSGNEHAAFAIGMLNPINMPSNAFWVHGIILNSSNQILIRASGDLEGSISLNASNFSDNTAIRAEGFYFIP